MKRHAALLFLLLAFATPASAATSRPWVTGYYAGWLWDWYEPENVDMTTMTHFVFGRYAPGGGTLAGRPGQLLGASGSGHATRIEDALIAKAHKAGVKALMMIGGDRDGSGFVASTAPETRPQFITNILQKCLAKDYDGVDIDWEEDRIPTQILALITELKEAAAKHPRYQGDRPFLITWPDYYVNVNRPGVPSWKLKVAAIVDQFNLMTYQLLWDRNGWDTWLFAALTGEGPAHPSSITSSVQAYVTAGIPRSKIGIGIGLYAAEVLYPNTGPRQEWMSDEYALRLVTMPREGPVSSTDLGRKPHTFTSLYSAGMLDPQYYLWDEAAQAGYYSYPQGRRYAGNLVGYLTTEDLHGTLQAKTAWVKAGNCGGTIVWTINYGYVNERIGNPPMEEIKKGILE